MVRSLVVSLVSLSIALAPSLSSAQDRAASRGARADTGDGDRAGRVGAEIAASMLAVGTGAVVGSLVFGGVTDCALTPGGGMGSPAPPSLGTSCDTGFALSALLGVWTFELVAPLVIAGAADRHGGRGDVAAAYLGLLVGGSVGAGLVALGYYGYYELSAQDRTAAYALLGTSAVIGSLAGLAGAIVGYELVDDAARRSSLRVTPTMSVSPDGATIGASGAF
jgi:hypothetical protein